MKRAIVTYAAGAHEGLLEVARPTYEDFARRHGYDFVVGQQLTDMPPAWNKIPLLLYALQRYEEVVWFDCDLVVVNPLEDFPPMSPDPGRQVFHHALVRHFEDNSEVPNSGVWRVTTECISLLQKMQELEVFRNHGWWEQAALLTLMGYTVPPEGTHFPDTKCHNVVQTRWYMACHFMRLKYNSHPNYRAEKPVIVHCSYPRMQQRLEVMRSLVRDPHYDYPQYGGLEEEDDSGGDEQNK